MVRVFLTNLNFTLKIRLKAHIFPVHLPTLRLFDMMIAQDFKGVKNLWKSTNMMKAMDYGMS